jgi:hypothetical protein
MGDGAIAPPPFIVLQPVDPFPGNELSGAIVESATSLAGKYLVVSQRHERLLVKEKQNAQ